MAVIGSGGGGNPTMQELSDIGSFGIGGVVLNHMDHFITVARLDLGKKI